MSRKGKPWEDRKESFEKVISDQDFDIVCLQEAMPDQIKFFSSLFPDHRFYGVGRDDGKGEGEHCPIFFNAQKFTLVNSATFWLSETPSEPSIAWGEFYTRLCSLVELLENSTGNSFVVFNTHLHLHPYAQIKGAELIRTYIEKSDLPIILVGDMNCPPGWNPIETFRESGLESADSSGALTFHLNGKGLRCLDHILIDPNWDVKDGGVFREKGGEVFPSDHFGLWADLSLWSESTRHNKPE